MTPTTTATLSLISVALIAFVGIVAGQNANSQTDLTTEIFKSEDTTPFRYLKNETTDDQTTQKSPRIYSTVQTTRFISAEPIVVTVKQETSSSKPKPVIKLRPRTSTRTTVKTTTVPNATVSSSVPNETDPTTRATTPGMITKNSSVGNSITKSQLNNIRTTIETVSSTQGNKLTEVTKPDPLKGFSLPRESKPETTPTSTFSTEETTFFQKPENSTFSTESREMEEDYIEQELDDTMNSMPELPELVLSNETHYKFHQDPEEASLDERITQIARQLAETGLRREYEERKLGHFIPISVRPIEHIPPSYHSKSKSIKFVKTTPTQKKSTLLKALTKPKSRPGIENLDKSAYELVTNLPEILRKNKSDKQIREMNGLIKVGGKRLISDTTDNMIPTNFPIFFELLQTSEEENSGMETKSESATTTTGKENTTRGRRLTDDTTHYSHVE